MHSHFSQWAGDDFFEEHQPLSAHFETTFNPSSSNLSDESVVNGFESQAIQELFQEAQGILEGRFSDWKAERSTQPQQWWLQESLN